MNTEANAWKSAVDARVSTTLDATAEAAAPVGPACSDLMDAIRTSSRGGKRLRALLVLAAHDAHRGAHHDEAVGVAAALELFQTAALLHDDVLDDSDTRRGRPAAHRTLAALHEDHDWHGSSAEFGASGAILAGDLALMASHRALNAAVSPLPTLQRDHTATLFASMTELCTMGQYLDMRIAAQPLEALGDQADDIRTTMRTKTASYSAEFPLALGAAIAGASDQSVQNMRDIGVQLGIAFQLRDDVLGVIGSPEVTGKPAGDDIREGKRTAILWRAWHSGSTSQREVIASTLGKRDASDAEVAAVVDILHSTNAITDTDQEIFGLAQRALDDLAALDLEPAAADTLRTIFTAATTRDA